MTKPENRKKSRGQPSPASIHAPVPPYVKLVRKRDGRIYCYYQRDGQRLALPGPPGSAAFSDAYATVHKSFEDTRLGGTDGHIAHTVDRAITLYLSSAEFRNLKPGSREDYRRVLDRFREHFGHLHLGRITRPWLNQLRDKYAPDPGRQEPGRPNDWNMLRSRMRLVTEVYRDRHPDILTTNPWAETKRLKTAKSKSHRPWPKPVLAAVMGEATPEFRALLIGYLLTAQRGGDVTRFSPDQYDPESRTLNISQEKTEEPLLIHVPEHLAKVFDGLKGRRSEVLFVTPRGAPWTTANAQETLQRLLANLGLPRFTLHGLRATGLVALKMLGFENRVLRALSGHTSDANLEIYLQGVSRYPLAHQAQEALAGHYGDLLDEATMAGRRTRAAGATGRQAARLGLVGRARDRRLKQG